ncbi:V-type ATP synthase subunit I [Halorientalis brevis]|uniref:A-type ATP synthase subunit I n=1 Tax=Halorientalis brevis TaxID=1126241 RepID=A0ABD6CAL2_9EURY|nr:V-type ATP synthase subunit I [Halorientalis brevis]
MLRPEQMSRVSVTGSKSVMDDVIETVYDLNLLHVTDYDGSWEGFDLGDPVEGAEEASQKLVTVRSLKSTLGVDEDDAGPTQLVTDEAIDEELERVRQDVNDLDDRRSELKDDLREVEEQIDSVEPYAELGIDLDLLQGYESLAVAVGKGDATGIETELAAADEVEEFMVESAGKSVAIFVYPEGDTDDVTMQDLLVGAQFQEYEIPDAEGSPEEYISELQHRKQQLESKLTTVEDELQDLKLEVSSFLLATEEKLAIRVQQAEAPLNFATTDNAFVAEGWIPTEEYETLANTLESTVGEHVDVEELERASYDSDGHATGHEPVDEGGQVPGEPTAADGSGKEKATDGGLVTMSHDEPPVIQQNAAPAKPFEALVEVINRPKYSEFDPTVIFFLTFPAFYGFMIGDLGYGILYTLGGFWLMRSFDSDMIKSLGGVGIWAGIFTMIFGVLYGEFFGLHQLGEIVWGGNPPIHKGLQPHYADYALAWLVISLLVGMVHLAIGWILDFIENLGHGFRMAMGESGSWLLMLFGLWAWIFAGANGSAPDLMYGSTSVFAGNPFPLGFTGFSPEIGMAGLGMFAVGLVLLVTTEPVEGVEFLNVLVNVLSYTRLAAVLLAKAGMAFVVNLLFFGVYVTDDGAWHFGISHSPAHMLEQGTYHGHEVTSVMFGGLMHGSVAFLLIGVLILVIGHLLVLILGVTSAGLQGVRLEYVEFFGKFYEGGGRKYVPFGYDREYTTEE